MCAAVQVCTDQGLGALVESPFVDPVQAAREQQQAAGRTAGRKLRRTIITASIPKDQRSAEQSARAAERSSASARRDTPLRLHP